MDSLRLIEQRVMIPTYEMGADLKEPAFNWEGNENWSIYPYAYQENLSLKKINKNYNAVILENKYLKLTILPELGGRIQTVFDKVKKTDMFYNPGVIKPSLIAIRGAWICGGVEFNSSSHIGHTLVTMHPVNYKKTIDKEKASITVGDVELGSRVEWSVTVTLYKNKPFFETKIKINNPNSFPMPWFFWTNTAIGYNDYLQMLQPSKYAMIWQKVINYPMSEGKDMSWIKNYHIPSDAFCRNIEHDTFIVYDHLNDYGVVHIADSKDVPGRKVFTWGRSDEMNLWKDLLSDDSSTYIEMQSGMLETQFETKIIQPRELKTWKECWYPFWAAPKDKVRFALEQYMKNRRLKRKKVPNRPNPYDSSKLKDFDKAVWVYQYGADHKAKKYFLEAVKKNRKKTESLLWLSMLNYKNGLFDEAKKFLEDASREKDGIKYVSECRKNMFGESNAAFLWDTMKNIVIADPRTSANFYFELALRRINKGNIKEAENILFSYLKIAGKGLNPIVYYYLGFLAKDRQKALDYYSKASKLSIDYVYPFRLEEIDILKKAIELNPKDMKARYYLGNIFYYHGRAGEAVKEWKICESLGMEHPILFRNLGYAYYKAFRNFEKARAYYKRSFKSDPYNLRVFFELNEILSKKRKFRELKRIFEDLPKKMKADEQVIKLFAALQLPLNQPQKTLDILSRKFYFLREGEEMTENLKRRAQFMKLIKKVGKIKFIGKNNKR